MKLNVSKFFIFCCVVCSMHLDVSALWAQDTAPENKLLSHLAQTGVMPGNILSTKSLVLYSYSFSDKELTEAQEYFQKIGIDAVLYYPIDMVLAGRDVSTVFADRMVKREISNLVILKKSDDGYQIAVTKFNGKPSLIDDQQASSNITNKRLVEALKALQRSLSSGYKKENMLINHVPEIGLPFGVIAGKRNEFYAVDMKVDLVAIPKFGDETADRELEQLLAANFPFKYQLTEPGVPEKELRKQGFFYVMTFIYTRAKVAQQLLGYNTSKSETAVVSVTYPDNAQQQLRNIPANTPVYKIYFKHIDSGNVFLGNKWDADLSWQSALLNQIRGMKAELRLN